MTTPTLTRNRGTRVMATGRGVGVGGAIIVESLHSNVKLVVRKAPDKRPEL
jgi:hypothetical protein